MASYSEHLGCRCAHETCQRAVAACTLLRVSPATSLRQRFESKVSPEPMSGCWLWTASLSNSGDHFGYGQIRVHDRPQLAHRVSWELHRGAVPAGLNVLHKCDNPGCVNPDHLFLGTHQDNVADRHAKGRTRQGHVPLRSGEHHGCAKLTWAKVDEIRALYTAGGHSFNQLAQQFGVSKRSILFVVHRKHWVRKPEAPSS